MGRHTDGSGHTMPVQRVVYVHIIAVKHTNALQKRFVRRFPRADGHHAFATHVRDPMLYLVMMHPLNQHARVCIITII